MNENEKAYRKMDSFYQEEKKGGNFGKTVFVPFISGILGSALVIGTCFSVPQIKNSLLGEQVTSTSATTINNSQQTPVVNTNFVSLSNYSDTSVAVARKNFTINRWY